MSNIYDTFRGVQAKRDACYNERSAAFIIEGALSQTVYHKRGEKDIFAAIVFNHKEGPDDITIYTLKTDEVIKSDYVVYDSLNYLVYEDLKQTDVDLVYKKQKAVECNITFTYKELIFNGYFTSSVRKNEDASFEGKAMLLPDETPLLILPNIKNEDGSNFIIDIGSEFTIEGKPFKVVEYDHITNKGIVYYYLERTTIKNIIENPEPIVEEEILDGTESIIQTEEEENDFLLRAMVEYTFVTEGAYFSATPAVEITSRKINEIKIKIPFGIDQVSFTTRKDNENIEKLYKVVL